LIDYRPTNTSIAILLLKANSCQAHFASKLIITITVLTYAALTLVNIKIDLVRIELLD